MRQLIEIDQPQGAVETDRQAVSVRGPGRLAGRPVRTVGDPPQRLDPAAKLDPIDDDFIDLIRRAIIWRDFCFWRVV